MEGEGEECQKIGGLGSLVRLKVQIILRTYCLEEGGRTLMAGRRLGGTKRLVSGGCKEAGGCYILAIRG